MEDESGVGEGFGMCRYLIPVVDRASHVVGDSVISTDDFFGFKSIRGCLGGEVFDPAL